MHSLSVLWHKIFPPRLSNANEQLLINAASETQHEAQKLAAGLDALVLQAKAKHVHPLEMFVDRARKRGVKVNGCAK